MTPCQAELDQAGPIIDCWRQADARKMPSNRPAFLH
jgi:hypothetical protein